MKKSELRQIIKEEVDNLNESWSVDGKEYEAMFRDFEESIRKNTTSKVLKAYGADLAVRFASIASEINSGAMAPGKAFSALNRLK